MTAQLAVSALRSAIARRQPARHGRRSLRPGRPISIPGIPGRARRPHGLTGSMGRVAAAGDNAAMESFYSLLQKNVLNRRALAHPRRARATRSSTGSNTPTTAAAANARLGKLTPVEYELAFDPATRRHRAAQHDQSQPPSTEPAADPSSGTCPCGALGIAARSRKIAGSRVRGAGNL